MRTPLGVLRDWSRTRQVAEQLAAAVKRARPGGVDVTREDGEMAAGVMYLLKHQPQKYTVVKFKNTRMLCLTTDLSGSITPDLHNALDRGRAIARPGEDLIDE